MRWTSIRRQQKAFRALGLRSAVSLEQPFTAQDVADLELATVGNVVLPSDPSYHSERQLSNFAFQQFPQLIVNCEVFQDVWRCLEFAHKFQLPVAVRSGGHNTAGLSVGDGMLIDLGRIDHIAVDPIAKRAVVGAGTSFGHLNATLDTYGLHVPGGGCADVRIAGYLQGGGYGFTAREFGMNCDNVIDATVMLADGNIVVANENQNADLLWAICGGTGGNFGIVLQVTYQLHAIGELWGFGLQWRLQGDRRSASQAAAALAELQANYMRTGAPKQLGYLALLAWQHDTPFLLIRGTYNGSQSDGKKAIDSLLAIDGVELAIDSMVPYVKADQALVDVPPGLPQVPYLAREDKESVYIVKPLAAEGWLALIRRFLRAPNRSTIVCIEPYGGTINEQIVGKNAFIHRDVDMNLFMDVFWMAEDKRPQAIRFLDRFMSATNAYSNGRSYQNYPRRAQIDYRRRYWGDWFETLLSIKQKYDPRGFFRSAQGITPEPGRRRRVPARNHPHLERAIVREPYARELPKS